MIPTPYQGRYSEHPAAPLITESTVASTVPYSWASPSSPTSAGWITREVLRAMVALAAARRATAVIVVPQFGAEAAVEQPLRRRILDEPGLPYVLVEIDPAWRVSGDVHPNARAAYAIAAVAATKLTSLPKSP